MSSPDLAKLVDEYWNWSMRTNPYTATFLGDFRFNDRLPEISQPAIDRQLVDLRSILKRTKAIDPAGLPENDIVSRDVLLHAVDADIQEREFKFHQWNLDQMMGPQVWLLELLNYHPLRNPKDAQDLAARFDAFPAFMDDYIANLKAGLAGRRTSPKIAATRVLAQLKSLIATPPEKSPFAEKNAGDAVMRAVRDSVYPAFAKLAAFLEKDYLAKAREEVGVWAVADGEDAYAFRVRYHTTTPLTPLQLHQIGRDELDSILAEMRAIAVKLGHKGDIPSFFAKLKADRANFWNSREEIVGHFERVLAKASAALPKWFGILPKTPCIVKQIEEYREKDCVAAFYYQPPEDLSRPGIFYANTFNAASRLKINNAALTLHEAVPGHHLQIAIACERKDLSVFRRNVSFTAFIEGWALYTERLGDEMGLYEDELERFGMLTYQAWRACRLVVDTGLHAMKWTREQAIEFFRKNIALGETEIVNEVDRYIIWPGQALAYKVGQREISRVRAEAQRTLGTKFDIRAFHDVVLKHGALPLTTMSENVRRWVSQVKK